MASLGASGSYVLAARNAGYSFEALAGRIVDVAHARYFGVPAPRGAREAQRANLGPDTHGLPASA
jgi:hypothetical protein